MPIYKNKRRPRRHTRRLLIATTTAGLALTAQQANAERIRYEFEGVVGSSVNVTPSLVGETYKLTIVLDTSTAIPTGLGREGTIEYFSVTYTGTTDFFAGTGGTFFVDTNGDELVFDLKPSAGATYTDTLGYTPDSEAGWEFDLSPTTFSASGLPLDSLSLFLGETSGTFFMCGIGTGCLQTNHSEEFGIPLISFQGTVIPEPTTAAALAGLTALTALRRRKQAERTIPA